MKATIEKWLDDISSSYWFVPTVMVVMAIALAILFVELDKRILSRLPPWFLSIVVSEPGGARSVLNAIAGSMITVAGVTFSVTISAVAYTTAQFGPRLLTNFMRDRGNQITLGTFIATFVYCILVLRTIRASSDELSVRGNAAIGEAFVPHIAVAGGIIMALASVAVLIYFIHHVPASINISTVIASISNELNEQIERLCKPWAETDESDATESEVREELAERRFDPQKRQLWPVLLSRETGYLQSMNTTGLLQIAVRDDLVIYSKCRPGYYVIEGEPYVHISPEIDPESDLSDQIAACFAFGNQRTHAQDMSFLIQEIIEIAARALSPGVNDPMTANACLKWLSASLSKMARRQPPDYRRFDEAGALRLQYPELSLVSSITAVSDTLRCYVIENPVVAFEMMRFFCQIKSETHTTRDEQCVVAHANALRLACESSWQDGRYLESLRELHEAVIRSINRVPRRRTSSTTESC